MHVSLPINAWTIGAALSILVIVIARIEAVRSGGGDFNFAPAILGCGTIVALGALWLGILLAKVLA